MLPFRLTLRHFLRSLPISCHVVTNWKLRNTYQKLTAHGQVLKTVLTSTKSLQPVGSRHPIVQKRFSHGPSLLGEEEWNNLPSGLEESITVQLRSLHTVDSNTYAFSEGSNLFVIDARAIQFPIPCGTKHHALNVILKTCAYLEEKNISFCFLTTTRFPPLDHPISQKASCTWQLSLLPRVHSFLFVCPFQDPLDPVDIELLTDPRIQRVAVWLDGIMGMYPHSFLEKEMEFWSYQLGLEKVAKCPILLCISKASINEAVHIFGPDYSYINTRCLSNFKPVESPKAPPDVPFRRYALTIGSSIPHKNITAAVVGFIGAWILGAPLDGLVMNAYLHMDQIDALRKAAEDLGLPASHLHFCSGVPKESFAHLLGAAQVVVIPSLHEGFSMPVIEALSADVPVLISDIPAHRELLCHANDFFDPTDPASLCKKMLQLFKNPEAVRRRQQHDLKKFYSPEEFSRALLPVIDSLIRPSIQG